MSFCLECGAPLPTPIIVNLNDPRTGNQPGGPPTNFGAPRQTEAFGMRNPQQFTPNFQPPPLPPQKKSNAKIFLVIGGIGALLLLFAVAGAAIVAYNFVGKSTPTPYPTSSPVITPTRTTSPNTTTSPINTPTPVNAPTADPTDDHTYKGNAKLNKIKVDYDVTQDNRLGMRIHIDFTVHKLKNVDCYLMLYFQKKDGTLLLTDSTKFQATNGQVAIYASLTPGFDETVYKDAVLFMPYEELNLTTGKYNLQIDIDLIRKGGERLEHLNLYEFKYEKI